MKFHASTKTFFEIRNLILNFCVDIFLCMVNYGKLHLYIILTLDILKMLESLLHHFCVFFRDNRIEYGWIEAVHKNKLIVVPQNGKNQYLSPNRIAYNWRDEKLANNATQGHELLEQHLKKAFHIIKKLDPFSIQSNKITGRSHSDSDILQTGIA